MGSATRTAVTRRQLLQLIGMGAGGSAMYQAMASLGLAAGSTYRDTPRLGAAPRGASVVVLGAGLAGMVAALELRDAGYRVQVLEYSGRAGGRCVTLRGGDRLVELGGDAQQCGFDDGLYINPGPWRIPYHHHGILAYCRRLGVPLENFEQANNNAYLHSQYAFDGKPQRYRSIKADYQGGLAELLAKSARAGDLDQALDEADRERLLGSLQWWGALDGQFTYAKGNASSERRGFARDAGGGLRARPTPSDPGDFKAVLASQLWQYLSIADIYELQGTLMQAVGGMDRIAQAFARELDGLIRFNARVVAIEQDERGVRVRFDDPTATGERQAIEADWCVCALPLSILGQIPTQVGHAMQAAIAAIPYAGAVKIGLQFKRRFWEQDDHIYGGITYTDLPIGNIAYPSSGYHDAGKAVLLGGYAFGADATRFTAMSPAERVAAAVEQGRQIHPQYADEFDGGVAVAWHRMPGVMGCFAEWTDSLREKHYDALCALDGRIVLAGEHASYLPGWQEGAVTSALDAIGRLHARAVAQGGAA